MLIRSKEAEADKRVIIARATALNAFHTLRWIIDTGARVQKDPCKHSHANSLRMIAAEMVRGCVPTEAEEEDEEEEEEAPLPTIVVPSAVTDLVARLVLDWEASGVHSNRLWNPHLDTPDDMTEAAYILAALAQTAAHCASVTRLLTGWHKTHRNFGVLVSFVLLRAPAGAPAFSFLNPAWASELSEGGFLKCLLNCKRAAVEWVEQHASASALERYMAFWQRLAPMVFQVKNITKTLHDHPPALLEWRLAWCSKHALFLLPYFIPTDVD